MDSLIGTFHLDPTAVLFQLINFGIVFAVLYFFAIKPLFKMLAERSKLIEQGIADAEINAKLVKEAEEVYKSELARARKESYETVQSAKKDAELQREQLLKDAAEQIARMTKDGEEKLAQEKSLIIAEAKRELADTVMQAAEATLDDVIGQGGLDKQLIEKRIHDHASH